MLGVLLTAAILALSLVMPGWLAALLVAAVLLIIAVILGLVGYRVLQKGIPPVPTESFDSIRRDYQAIRGIGKRSTP
jgi:ABC-type transporter Mla maintaining outer membrane lipid asymmetry permease subunit MlaE